MKKFFERVELEQWLSAFSGVVSLVAIFYEMKFAGFDSASIAGGIKDIAGTTIAVVMLIVAISALRPKKEEPFSFEKELKEKLNLFVSENGRMLKAKDTDEGNHNFFELYMETDFNAYFGEKTTLRSGWFMRMPPINETIYSNEGVVLSFHLNQGTFFGHNKPENEAEAYATIGEKIKSLVIRENDETTLACQYNKTNKEIEIKFKKPLTTKDDVDILIALIKKIYNSYLVLGDAGVNV